IVKLQEPPGLAGGSRQGFDLIESLSSVFPIGRRPSFERWSFKCRNGAGNPHREEDDEDDDEEEEEDDELSSFFLSIKKLPQQREAFFRPNTLQEGFDKVESL
ncbi:MAG: hypothetical protein ACLRWP_20720, partial [Bilophila wadsworthia]